MSTCSVDCRLDILDSGKDLQPRYILLLYSILTEINLWLIANYQFKRYIYFVLHTSAIFYIATSEKYKRHMHVNIVLLIQSLMYFQHAFSNPIIMIVAHKS